MKASLANRTAAVYRRRHQLSRPLGAFGGGAALMAAAVFCLYLTGSTYWAIVQDTVRGAHVGGVSGFIHSVANCSGIVGPTITGFIVQYTGAFTAAFVLAGCLALVGVLGVIVFVRPISPDPVTARATPA